MARQYNELDDTWPWMIWNTGKVESELKGYSKDQLASHQMNKERLCIS